MLDVFTTLPHALEECFLPADLAMATFHDQTMKHFSMTEDAGYLFNRRGLSRACFAAILFRFTYCWFSILDTIFADKEFSTLM